MADNKIKKLLDNVDKILCNLGGQYKSNQHVLINEALADLRKAIKILNEKEKG